MANALVWHCTRDLQSADEVFALFIPLRVVEHRGEVVLDAEAAPPPPVPCTQRHPQDLLCTPARARRRYDREERSAQGQR